MSHGDAAETSEDIALVRVYDAMRGDLPAEGAVFLVDRLWPRGVRKEALPLDGWIKDAAPSPELRTWFGHDPQRWQEFRRRYLRELKGRPQALRPILEALKRGPVTLLYAAKDTAHTHALVLRDYLDEMRAAPTAD